MLAGSSASTLHDTGDSRGSHRVAWRYATAKDVLIVHKGAVKPTLRAIVVTLDDDPVAILGVSRERGIGKFFADYMDELEPYLPSITVMRAIKASMEFVKDFPGPVYAVAQHAEGARVLTRLGFTHISGDLFLWHS